MSHSQEIRRKLEILGEFHEYLAATKQKVRSFIGSISSTGDYQPHLAEVAYVLEVPLEFFRETKPVVEKRLRQGRIQDIYFYDFNGETIWGLTARIIRDFVDFIEE